VPGAPVGVELRIGGVGQRTVHAATVRRLAGLVHGRAHQRMTKPHPGADLQQPGGLRGLGRLRIDPQVVGRAPQQRHFAGRLGSRDQQQQLRLGWQAARVAPEAVLDAARDAQRVRQFEPARQLCRLPAAGELQQRQGVAACFGDDPLTHPFIERRRDRGSQQRFGIGVGKAAEGQLGQAGERADVAFARVAHSEHQRHPLGHHPPRHERQHLRGCLVEPLRIVDETQQRIILGDLGQQVEGRQPDQEPVRRRTVAQAKRHAEGSLLWLG
jgi:hypothetical protein